MKKKSKSEKLVFFNSFHLKEKEEPDWHKPTSKEWITKPHYVTAYAWHKQKERTNEESKTILGYSDIVAITVFSMAAAIIILLTKAMVFMRWSTFPDNSYFFTWHPITPWIGIFGSILYIAALYMKKIDFWLAYYPAVVGIIYLLINLAMINSWVSPQDLANFFSMFGLDEMPHWITGGSV